MAAEQDVDQKQGVIFQGLQQQTWFEPETLDRYIAALLKAAEARRENPQMQIPDPLPVEKMGAVPLKEIEETLVRFNAGLEQLSVKDLNLFDSVQLTMLRVRLSWAAEYTPPPPASNMPNPELMKQFLHNAHEVDAAKKDAGKPGNLDAQIKASLELFRENQALKIASVKALTDTLWQNSSYIKDLRKMEQVLGGHEQTKEALHELLMNEANIVANQFTLKMLADLYNKNPSEAVTYFMTQLRHRIGRDDFLRTALDKLHPEAKAQAMKEIEEKAHEAVKQAQPAAALIRKEQDEAAEAHGFDKEKDKGVENPFSFTHRPIAEVRRLTDVAQGASVNIKLIKLNLDLAAHRILHRPLSPFLKNRIVSFLLRHPTNIGQQNKYLAKVFGSENIALLRSQFLNSALIQGRLNIIRRFTTDDVPEAAALRPDLLNKSTLQLLTTTTTTPIPAEQAGVIHEVAARTGVPVDVAAAHASGVSERTVAVAAAQVPVGHPGKPLFERFQQNFGKLQQALRPPKVPTEAPPLSEHVAAEFQGITRVNAFRQQVGGAFRFLRLDRAVNFVARSAPVRAVTNTVTAPFRFVGNAITGVKNWAKSQVISGATSVANKLIAFGAAQAAKAGIMGVAGKAATWAGTNLLAVAGGTALKSIPVIGQAIGAVQAVGGATLGFLGATLDFVRGKKSFGEWGAAAFKSAGTLIGAAVGGLIGAGIGLLGLGVGAIPGALIGAMVGAMVGGMLTGGLAKFAKDPAEVLKSLLGLLLIGGFALGALAGWLLGHGGSVIGALIGQSIGGLIGSVLGSVFGPIGTIAGGLAGRVVGGVIGWKVGGAVDGWVASGGPAKLWNGISTFAQRAWLGTGQFLGNLWAGAGNFLGGLFTTGQIALAKLFGWLAQGGWALGGGVIGAALGSFFGPLGALFGAGAGAAIGSWLGSGGLNSLLSGIGPTLTNSVVGATEFLGSLTAPLTASSIVSTTTAVALGGVAAAGGLTMFFVIPSILSALYVPPDAGSFAQPKSCPTNTTLPPLPAPKPECNATASCSMTLSPLLQQVFESAGSAYNVPVSVLSGIFFNEGGFNDPWSDQRVLASAGDSCQDAITCGNVSSTGARGPWQFIIDSDPAVDTAWEANRNAAIESGVRPTGYSPDVCNIVDATFAAAKTIAQGSVGAGPYSYCNWYISRNLISNSPYPSLPTSCTSSVWSSARVGTAARQYLGYCEQPTDFDPQHPPRNLANGSYADICTTTSFDQTSAINCYQKSVIDIATCAAPIDTEPSVAFSARGLISIINVVASRSNEMAPGLTCSWAGGKSLAVAINANYFKDDNSPVGFAGYGPGDVQNYGCGTACATKTFVVYTNGTAAIVDSSSISSTADIYLAVSGTDLHFSPDPVEDRTGLGIVGNDLILFTISNATTDQFIAYAHSLGLSEATSLQLDGGGSSTFCQGSTPLIGNARLVPVNIGLKTATITAPNTPPGFIPVNCTETGPYPPAYSVATTNFTNQYKPSNQTNPKTVPVANSVTSYIQQLVAWGNANGFKIYVDEGYRTYNAQLNLCQACQAAGSGCSAERAEWSQHRTGRAVDIYDVSSGAVTSLPIASLTNQFPWLRHPVATDPPHYCISLTAGDCNP